MKKIERAAAVYHGQDEKAAIDRARNIGGAVVWSWKDRCDSVDLEWGYWSDPEEAGGMLRNGEIVVWKYGHRVARVPADRQ